MSDCLKLWVSKLSVARPLTEILTKFLEAQNLSAQSTISFHLDSPDTDRSLFMTGYTMKPERKAQSDNNFFIRTETEILKSARSTLISLKFSHWILVDRLYPRLWPFIARKNFSNLCPKVPRSSETRSTSKSELRMSSRAARFSQFWILTQSSNETHFSTCLHSPKKPI